MKVIARVCCLCLCLCLCRCSCSNYNQDQYCWWCGCVCCMLWKDQDQGSRIRIRIKIVDDKVLCGVCCGSRLHQTLPSVIAPCTRLTEECIFIYDFVYLCMYLYQWMYIFRDKTYQYQGGVQPCKKVQSFAEYPSDTLPSFHSRQRRVKC